MTNHSVTDRFETFSFRAARFAALLCCVTHDRISL
jgi:hypothetical protein